jgi:NAD(P)-dependent dehydrogenase (short-subunit alcohol dehydrogenase family)
MDHPPFAPPDLVVVTGAGRGIGRAIALGAAKSGPAILCISRTSSALQTAAAIRAAGGSAETLETDLSDYVGTGQAVADWLGNRPYQRIGVVLAAGVLGPSGPLWQTCLEEWDRTWRVNVLGNLAVLQACLPRLRAGRFGRVLFFAGGGAAYANPLFPAYAASKTALVREVENLHEDLKELGDFVVTILAPGAIDTEMLATVREKGGEVRTTVPIEEPVAFACSFLSAPNSGLSGCFVHVRDAWKPLLDSSEKPSSKDRWKLRRVE